MVTPFKRIAVKMTALVLLGTILVFTCIFTYSYIYSRQLILDERRTSTLNLAIATAGRIDLEARTVKTIAQNFACFLESTPLDGPELQRAMKHLLEKNPGVFGSGVMFEPGASGGKIQGHAPYAFKGNEGVEFADLAANDQPYFQQDYYHIPKMLRAPVWSEPYFDEGGGNILMATFSVPFFEILPDGRKGAFKGVVGVDMSLQDMTFLVSSINIGHTGHCFLVSGNGTFLTHPIKDWVMRESLFSVAEELGLPQWRRLGREIQREQTGFTHLGKSNITGQDSYIAWAKVGSTGWSMGAVFPKDEIFSEVGMLFRTMEVLAVVGIVLLLGVSLLVARSIAKPLRRMARATAAVARGETDIDLSDIRTLDEVGQLARSFTRMVHGLKERDFIRDTFGRYLTKEVVNRLLEHRDGLKLGGESRDISVLMSDIRGFTALTVSMPPEQLISLLNRYLGKMLDILIDYGGVIDEIIGDGILAFFGAPEPLEDHPAAAVACALKMQLAMDEINAVSQAQGLPNLEMGIAVNSGQVVLGNIGSEKRTKYGAVGPEVNFTGRMESFTLGGQVLISESTYTRLQGVIDVKKTLQVLMKGITGLVSLYDVRGIRGVYSVQIPEREEKLLQLKERMGVQIRRMTEKTVDSAGEHAWITHLSQSAATLVTTQPLSRWDNISIQLLNDKAEPMAGDVYAKVISTAEDGHEHKAEIHFTSIFADAAKIFRRAPVIGTSGSGED